MHLLKRQLDLGYIIFYLEIIALRKKVKSLGHWARVYGKLKKKSNLSDFVINFCNQQKIYQFLLVLAHGRPRSLINKYRNRLRSLVRPRLIFPRYLPIHFDQGKFRPRYDWSGLRFEIGLGRVKIDGPYLNYGIDFRPRSIAGRHYF